jgi:hypothetical protein
MANLYSEKAEFKEPASGMVAQKIKTQIVKEYTELQQSISRCARFCSSCLSFGRKNVIVDFEGPTSTR